MNHALETQLTRLNEALNHLEIIQTLAQKDDKAEISAYEYAYLTCDYVERMRSSFGEITKILATLNV